jgi:hypoxanthine phosphoribosyltransferase
MPNIKIKDLEFKKLISSSKIEEKIAELAAQISQDYKDKTPVFLPILNGSFMFASDLLKEVGVPCRVSFVKTSSYAGTSSTGQLKTLIGHDESLFQQHIIVLEDIVDTGLTLDKIIEELRERGAKSVEAVSLLRKKQAREKKIDVKYVGFELENEFVLGYGLDYDGLGRNLKDIYKALDSTTKLG